MPKDQEGNPQKLEIEGSTDLKKIFKVADFSIEMYCKRATLPSCNTFLWEKSKL